ncbi:MAG TPA: enoyl-CoA hydratase-related protein [Sphingobium sp.]|uniref:enoyl-CoA hydratase-related protein n=1 Tax=Sphingobium sp. TaxID=1912891 RepID=UPI002ED2B4F0
MREQLILYSVEDGVGTLTLNRPECSNGWTVAMGQMYFSQLEQAARDQTVRVIVVTGAGRAFCAGGDGAALQNLADASGDEASVTTCSYVFPFRIGKPVIAAINGACFGIGLQQALCCDIRIAADDAKFSTGYARRGLVAEYGMSWLLPRIVGTGHAMDLLLSARLVRAPEAERMGLINRIVPAADLVSEAVSYARDIAKHCAPGALRQMKEQAILDLSGTLSDAYARAETMLDQATRSDDFREGVKSWQAQRAPDFPPLDAERAIIDFD